MTLQERVFDAFVSFVLRHRVLVMVAVLAITAGFANVISELPLMTTLRDVLPDDTPNFARYEKARERFGGDETVIIALEGEHFTEAGLERLATLTTALEEHPLVDRATSLANTDWIHGEPGKLRIDSYLDIDPAEARKAALEDPLVKGNLISPDGRLAIVVVLLIPNDGKLFTSEAVAAHVRKHVDRIPGGLPQLEKPGGKRRGIEMAKQLVADEVQGEAQKAGYTLEQIHVGGFPAVFGRLLIESERTIKVLFPVSPRGTIAPAPAPPEPPGRMQDALVLVIDDEDTVRTVACQVLERHGCRTVHAADGEAGVGLFRQRPDEIDLILLDLTMPVMDGEEAFRIIRSIRPDVPIIVTSGYNRQDTTTRFAGRATAGFLQKPWTAQGLIHVVSNALEGGEG